MDTCDVCVIGGGPAGYAAAMRCVDFGKRVLLVERDRIGGAGIFDGALSSKALWELSQEVADIARRFGGGGRALPEIGFAAVTAQVNDAVKERADLLVGHLDAIRQQRPDAFEWVRGTGRLADAHTVEVATAQGTRSIAAAHIVLATGSRPRILPTIPVDERIILTSDGISALKEFPKSIVILGAGVIGCEFATIFSNFGRTQVYLIDKEPRILPFEDEDVARVIQDNLEAAGVFIHHGCKLVRMGIEEGQVAYVVEHTDDGRQERFTTERGLISVGRVPNVEGLGLAEAGIACSASGHIVDESTRTSVPHIYAVGDLTADIALLNVGELEGRHAAERMFGRPLRPMTYNNISTIMFLSPETAGVGMNELQARQQGRSYRVASYAFQCIPRAVAMRKTQGFFKILVTDDGEMKILGMRAIGEHASSAIQAVALLISMDKGIEELAELIHPHPSIIEGIQECVRMLLGKSILKPSAFAETLTCRRWHGGRYEPFVPGS
jgi:dihydrolipoamide dehydrogenase